MRRPRKKSHAARYRQNLFKLHESYNRHNCSEVIWKRDGGEPYGCSLYSCDCGYLRWKYFDKNNNDGDTEVDTEVDIGWINSAMEGRDGKEKISNKVAMAIMRHFFLKGVIKWGRPCSDCTKPGESMDTEL